MRTIPRLPREAHFASAAISFAGSLVALLIAARTHAGAPICGAPHCAACYVAAILAAIGLVTVAMARLGEPARSRSNQD